MPKARSLAKRINAGRPRLDGAREPSGRPSRSERGFAPMEIRRLVSAAIAGMRDPQWGTPLGWMFLSGKIDEKQYSAGVMWLGVVERGQKALGSPAVKSPSLARAIKAADPDPESDEGQAQTRREASAARAFFDAHAALCTAGLLPEHHVRALVEHHVVPVGYEAVLHTQSGLSALAGHFGLTGRH
jgi:hypothetical protein